MGLAESAKKIDQKAMDMEALIGILFHYISVAYVLQNRKNDGHHFDVTKNRKKEREKHQKSNKKSSRFE